MPGYPVELDLSGRLCLVVGLGAVGRRKAAGVLAAGGLVRGVDPVAGWDEPPAGVELRREPYRREHMQGASLVFAASTPEVDRRVAADARAAGIWVNIAGGPDAGDFRVPAVRRDGPLLLTVSTSGAGPALAAALRDRAAAALGPAAAGVAALHAELRPAARARVADPARQRAILRGWADPRWLDLWSTAGPEAVRQAWLETITRAENRS